MAAQIPAMPKEVADWCGFPMSGLSESTPRRRMVTMLEDWRTGASMHDMIVRNERILAMAP